MHVTAKLSRGGGGVADISDPLFSQEIPLARLPSRILNLGITHTLIRGTRSSSSEAAEDNAG